jgi:hypothetical protein
MSMTLSRKYLVVADDGCGSKSVLPSRKPDFRNTSESRHSKCSLTCLKGPSRPGEFHPEPLTDSGLDTLASSGSCHRAKAAAFRRELELLLLPVGSLPTPVACPLRSTGITPLQHYYGAVRPSPAHQYFRPRGWSRLCLFPWHRRPGSHVPYKSQIEVRAASMPDAAWAVSGHPPS